MKTKQILSIILALFLILPSVTACSNSTKEVINPKQTAELQSELAGTMGQKMNYDPDSGYTGYLGYGYDIAYSGYFNSRDISVGALILDMDALVKKGFVYSGVKAEPTSSLYMGESLKTYQENVSSKTGLSFSYGLFSKIQADFSLTTDSTSSESSKSVYIKNLVKLEKERQYINTSAISYEDLKKYTNERVLESLNGDTSNLTAGEKQTYFNDLFSTYGTHILVDIILGGKMDLSYVYDNRESKTQQAIRAEVNAAYSTLKAKASGSVSAATENTATNFVAKTSFQCARSGGTVTGDITTYEDAKSSYKVWSESIEKNESLAFIDVGSSCDSSLIGIWKLAEQEKQQDIYLAYLNYLNAAGTMFADIDKKTGEQEVPLYIHNVYVGMSGNSALARSDIESQISQKEPNALYKIVADDLNKGVHGDYIYVGYTLTPNINEAITDIKVEWWSKDSNAKPTYDYNGVSYTCEKKDLNSNAGGKFVYIYYTKVASAGKPLTDIGVEIDGTYSFGKSASGWTSVIGLTSSDRADCNKGSGGPFIYLWYKR